MALVMEAVAHEFVNPAEYDFFAELRYGGNGDAWGTAELDVGSTSGDIIEGRRTWDQDIYDGVDSGWQKVQLIVDLRGSSSRIQWQVGDQMLSYYGPHYTSISQVQILTGVSAQAAFFWDSLNIGFYSAGNLTDSYYSQYGPSVDRRLVEDYGSEQRILTIAPESAGNDFMLLTGRIRMNCPAGVFLDENAVFSQVLISADA